MLFGCSDPPTRSSLRRRGPSPLARMRCVSTAGHWLPALMRSRHAEYAFGSAILRTGLDSRLRGNDRRMRKRRALRRPPDRHRRLRLGRRLHILPGLRVERGVLLAAQRLAGELDEVVADEGDAEHGIVLAAPEGVAGGAQERAAVV